MVGPPVAGKGTQAALLATILGVPHIWTGDIFRENIAPHSCAAPTTFWPYGGII
jgi:adenylate kinase family enzyme